MSQNFIVDRRMPKKMIKELKTFGNVFLSAPAYENKINTNIANHPDIQIHFVNENTAFAAASVYEYYKKILPSYVTVLKGLSDIGDTYPKDCAYNIARINKTIICNIKYADKLIFDYYLKNDYNIINVKQGYSKCNICPISKTAFITEDTGIVNIVTKNTLDIKPYLISPGGVKLDGYNCGFIGGASGITLDNTVLFCGNPKNNNQLFKILVKENVKFISLSDADLYDFGTIICF